MNEIKSLLLYSSLSKGNTSKIAQVIAREIKSDLMRTADSSISSFIKYSLIGFGSGIYRGRPHNKLIELIEKLPDSVRGKYAFIFCTSRSCRNSYLTDFENILASKGFIVLGSFQTKGFYTNSVLNLFGGINKGRPSPYDYMDASDFAKSVKEAYLAKIKES